MQTLRRTATVLIWPTIAWLGAACDRLDAPTAVVQFSVIPPEEGGPGKVTGGGQTMPVEGGRASFGFNVKREEEGTDVASGHLNYLNHVTGVHLNCEVQAAAVIPPTETTDGTAMFGGYECRPNGWFTARVIDKAEPGKFDEFRITYATEDGAGTDEGGELRSGNIQVHKNQ
jgi:hypothetical protein